MPLALLSGGAVMSRDNAFADGSASYPTIVADGNSPSIMWPGGDGAFTAVGTFGGGTVTLQMQAPDSSTWLSLGSGTALTASGVSGFSAPQCLLRIAVSGSTTPSLKAWTRGISPGGIG